MNFRFKNSTKHFYQHTKFRIVTKTVTAIREHRMKEQLPICPLAETQSKLEKPQITPETFHFLASAKIKKSKISR